MDAVVCKCRHYAGRQHVGAESKRLDGYGEYQNYTMAAILPEFVAKKRSHIIVTSSVSGTKSVPGNAVYCGTKHFVRAMLVSFRTESVLEGTNIRTTLIYPGTIKTEFLNTIAPPEMKSMVEDFQRISVWNRMQSQMRFCMQYHSRIMFTYPI